jgi:hypothetical protein
MLRRLLTVPAALFLVWGCATSSPIKSTHDYDPTIDFSAYRTYAFISENPMIVASDSAPSPLTQGRLMQAIRDEMAAKGFREVGDPEQADMAIAFTVGARDKIRVDSYPTAFQGGLYPYGGGFYGYGYGPEFGTETVVRQYTQGQLAVDIFDVAGHRPFYHGTASKKITSSDREDPRTLLRAAAAEALGGFPPDSTMTSQPPMPSG